MSTQDLILGTLNDQQRKAVETVEGPVLILAGAGSGKTRALTHRVAYLIEQGVPPWQILAVTFTNKAANEMKERILRLLKMTDESGREKPATPMIGTFHAVCVRMLRRDIESIGRNRNFIIYDSDDQEKVMKEVLKDMQIAPEELKPKTALAHIGRYKCEAMSVSDVKKESTTSFTERMAQIYDYYQHFLRDANALDFDDLILETVRLLHDMPDVLARYQNTWQFIHVDEYQDTNHAQYLLISLLAKAHKNICVIGDPDQSIYAFRGADIRNILEFQIEYKDATCIKLEQNYRSTQLILDAADAVIAANPNRPEKKMWTEKTGGPNIVLQEVASEKNEAEDAVRKVLAHKKNGIRFNDQVILYRTNAQSRLFEETCLKFGIPYRIVGGVKFYARKEVKDVLAYLYVIMNPHDTISLLRIINVPTRKIGKATLVKLQTYANEHKINLWQTLEHIEMVEGLNEPVRNRLSAFVELIRMLQAKANTIVVGDLIRLLLETIKMERWVRDETEEGESRWQNILELLNVTQKYDALEPHASLTNFLEEVALVSEVDKLNEMKDDALTLMTVHLCKGLEFRSVMIAGCEEGLFPHSSALIDRDQLEEERRLMYVAMTRAKEHLHLLHTRERLLWGDRKNNPRSRFLDDIPQTIIDSVSDELGSPFAWNAGKSAAFVPPFAKQHGEWDMNQDMHEIEKGMRIAHPHFGEGTVQSLAGDIIEVAFDSGQTKKLAMNIAPLVRL